MIKPIEEFSYLGGLKKMDNSLKPLPGWGIITDHKNFKGRKAERGEEPFNLIQKMMHCSGHKGEERKFCVMIFGNYKSSMKNP